MLASIRSIKDSPSNTLEQHRVFSIAECRLEMIKDRLALQEKILEVANQGRWDKDHIVVTQVQSVSKIAIFVAQTRNTELQFNVEGEIAPGPFNLAKVLAKAQSTKQSIMAASIWGSGNFTPLFKAIGVKKRFFGLGNPQIIQIFTKTQQEIEGTTALQICIDIICDIGSC